MQCGLQFLLIPPGRFVEVHHKPLPMSLSVSSWLWHVQGGCSTPTLLPDVHLSRALFKGSPTPGSQGTFPFAEFRLLQENYALGTKRTMKFQYRERRGEKGHIESKFVIILMKEIICKNLNLYFLISLFLCPQLLTHLLHPLAACQKSVEIYYFTFY